MKTRFSSLVTLKKNAMDKSERGVQQANSDLKNANTALELSYNSLQTIDSPQNGHISDLLAQRALLSSQRAIIIHNKEWVNFAKKQLELSKEQLKRDMIEFEKFKYLELEEMKKVIKKRKMEEAKQLDEVALMTYGRKDK